jgi:hypothetical protein
MSGAMLNAHFFQKMKQTQQALDAEEEEAEDGQQEEDGPAALADPDISVDVDWEEQWNADAEDDDDSSARDDSLSAKYANLTGETSETYMYNVYNNHCTGEFKDQEAELCGVFARAFSHILAYEPGDDLRDSNALVQEIADKTAFRVKAVVRLLNRTQYEMHQAFAKSYNIHESHNAYHGTSTQNAKLIEQNGFSGAAGERCKYGKGIYLSTGFFQAASYAQPYCGLHQEVLVVQVLKGPTAVGHQGQVRQTLCCLLAVLLGGNSSYFGLCVLQVDYGVNEHGKKILTLTNADESILCIGKGTLPPPTL